MAVVKTAGWADIREGSLNKEYDAAHRLAPMPLSIILGWARRRGPSRWRRWRPSTARPSSWR
ncbi:MAG TPA: hypothetical protein VEA41_04620 [Salinarimonas sp.]|nr:hypothetical protein [Salinarimonas sp.]